VFDEFGGKLGTFALDGKTITPEDYGVADAPPLLSIVRPWVAARGAEKPAASASKGVCRVTWSAGAAEADLETARTYRAWLKKQPGLKASYFAHDPASGRALTISIWQSQAHLDAALAAPGREGAPLKASAGTPPASGIELFPFVEEP
jgi:hypothetical protein